MSALPPRTTLGSWPSRLVHGARGPYQTSSTPGPRGPSPAGHVDPSGRRIDLPSPAFRSPHTCRCFVAVYCMVDGLDAGRCYGLAPWGSKEPASAVGQETFDVTVLGKCPADGLDRREGIVQHGSIIPLPFAGPACHL